MQVNTNGDLSFGRNFTESSPELFPGPDFLVAPFWADLDISNGVGSISYEVHTETDDTTLLADVSNFIRNITGSQFGGRWMLLAEWRNAPQYSGFPDLSIVSCHFKHLERPIILT